MIDPIPRWPEHRGQQGFRVARWNVDNQMRNSLLGDCLQMPTDGIDVDAVHEFRARLENRPSLHHKIFEVPSGHFRLHRFQRKFALEKIVACVTCILRYWFGLNGSFHGSSPLVKPVSSLEQACNWISAAVPSLRSSGVILKVAIFRFAFARKFSSRRFFSACLSDGN